MRLPRRPVETRGSRQRATHRPAILFLFTRTHKSLAPPTLQDRVLAEADTLSDAKTHGKDNSSRGSHSNVE